MKTKSIPQLRFPEFKEEWQTNRFDEVFDIGAGGDVSQNHFKKLKDNIFTYPVYSNSESESGLYGYSDIYKEKSNCITVTGRGRLGIAIARKEPFYPIVRLLTLRSKLKSNVCFFENSINKINFFVESTGVPQLTGPQISIYKISFPAFEEQEKIAGFLGVVDEKIEKLENKKELFENFKKGVMQKIFSQKIRFKDKNGKDFPDWEEKKLGEILEEAQKQKEFNPEKTELLTVKLHNLGIIKSGNFPKPTRNGRPYYKRFIGELLIGRQNFHNGGLGFVNKITDGLIASNAISSFLFTNTVNKKFIYYYISRADYYRRVGDIIGGTGQKEISTTEFLKLKIKTPILKEQEKIAKFLTSLDNKVELINNQLEQSRFFKKSLLQQMFV